MPVTIKFTNTHMAPLQAQIIQDATEKNDGVMTKAQAKKLNSLSPSPPGEATLKGDGDSAFFVPDSGVINVIPTGLMLLGLTSSGDLKWAQGEVVLFLSGESPTPVAYGADGFPVTAGENYFWRISALDAGGASGDSIDCVVAWVEMSNVPAQVGNVRQALASILVP